MLVIQNNDVRVSYDPVGGLFEITGTLDTARFTVRGSLSEVRGAATAIGVDHPSFGRGDAIRIESADGAGGVVEVFPNLPFVLLRRTLANAGSTAVTMNRVPIAAVSVATATALTTLGTGGLQPAGRNPGSYGWLAVAEPQSRVGVVAGFLTFDRASGVLLPGVENDAGRVEARCDYGRLRLEAGQRADSETLAIGLFADARLGLEAWADAVARVYRINLLPQPDGFCTWYTEKHGRASDEKNLADLTDFAAANLKPYGFGFVQIDDGWQRGEKRNGPKKDFTNYDPDRPYPAGMKAMADHIKSRGLTPGIWFMPFAGTHDDPHFAAHPDWFVKRTDGTPYDTAWGGTSLDMTHPAAQGYLRSIVTRLAHDWGYTYFKMDGLYTGLAAKQVYVNSGYKEDDFGDAVFFDPSKTNIEAFRDGLKLVREAAGPGVFFLGCTVAQNMRSFTGSIGLVDAMRIGADNSGSYAKWATTGPLAGSRNYFLNGRIWYNDPDPSYVRASLTLNEARMTASFPAIAGQLHSNSDWIPDLPAERLDILKRTMPAHGRTARPVDLFENDPPCVWTVTDEKSATGRDVIALFNWADAEATFDLPVARLDLPTAERYAAFDFWSSAFLAPFADRLTATLPEHSCAILAVRPLLDRPFVLSTSRHVTQGMIDVVDEHWDAGQNVLVGECRVVGGDSYELRLYAPESWTVQAAELSAEDVAAGCTVTYRQEENGVRVVIASANSRSVHWTVGFAPPMASSRR